MIVFAPIITDDTWKEFVVPRYDGVQMSLEKFRNWNPEVESGIKYEWNDGTVEAEGKMRIGELKILLNLQKKLRSFENTHKGEFLGEVECFFPKINKLRIPDICYLTIEQIQNNTAEMQIPQFVMEVVSPSNTADELERKVQDYFSGGVKVVWVIYPELKRLKLYNSPKQIQVCTDSDVCDTTVLPKFQITVNEIFQDLK